METFPWGSLEKLGWFGYVLATISVLNHLGLLKRRSDPDSSGNGHGRPKSSDRLTDAISDLALAAKLQTSLLERLVNRADQAHDILVTLAASEGIHGRGSGQ